MLAVGSSEDKVRAIATYISGICPVIIASFFRQLKSMQAGRYELGIFSTIVRIVIPGVAIPIFVQVIHDGADLYLEA